MSNNKELSELLNNNFNKYKEEKKQKIQKEQKEIIDKYNNVIIPYNNLNTIGFYNFYKNYFNNTSYILIDLIYYKKFVHDGRLFYLGITFIFISLIYFLYVILNNIIKIDIFKKHI